LVSTSSISRVFFARENGNKPSSETHTTHTLSSISAIVNEYKNSARNVHESAVQNCGMKSDKCEVHTIYHYVTISSGNKSKKGKVVPLGTKP
jgi:hypothetical protein